MIYFYFLQERNYLAFYQKHNFFTKFLEGAISAILTKFKLFEFEKVYTAGSLMLIDGHYDCTFLSDEAVPKLIAGESTNLDLSAYKSARFS